MRNILLLLVFGAGFHFSYAQGKVSTCTSSDSIRKFYQNTADKIATDIVYDEKSAYMDSAKINKSYSNRILKALVAVYNATNIPQRDTVVTLYQIQAHRAEFINGVILVSELNTGWSKRLIHKNFPTGNKVIDSIIQKHKLRMKEYFISSPFAVVKLDSDSNYNTRALAKTFEKADSLKYSEIYNVYGDGNNIKAKFYPGYTELEYSFGSGDCPSGCPARAYWKFWIYDNCHVEFKGRSGDILESEVYNIFSQTNVYPNPFNDYIITGPNTFDVEATLHNTSGEIIRTKMRGTDRIHGLNKLPAGLYFIQTEKDGIITKTQLFKQ